MSMQGSEVSGLLIRFLASGYLLLAAGNWFLAAAEGCPSLQFLSSVLCRLTSVL